MTNCLVIISNRPADFGRLVTPPDQHRRWQLRETADVWLVENEVVFNAHINPRLEGYSTIFVAWHPSDADNAPPPDIPIRAKLKEFSHSSDNDPIWKHGHVLVEHLCNHTDTRPFNTEGIKAVNAMCEVIFDRQGQLRERSLRCLVEVWGYALIFERAKVFLNEERLRELGVSEDDLQRIQTSLFGTAGGLLNERLDRIAVLRDLLLGPDDPEQLGIVHQLGSSAHGRTAS